MFGLRMEVRWVAVVLAGAAMAAAVRPMEAQSTQRPRRETTASRQARIDRTIQEEYGHRWEVGGGGGYLRFRSGEYLQKNNEVTWQAAATRYFSPTLGLMADVRGSFGDAKVPNNIYNEAYRPLINEYTFMVGPNYRFYRKEKWAASVHVLGGMAIGNFDGGAKGLLSQDLGLWESANRPVFSAGVSLDYNLYPNMAFRVTPTYVATMFQLAPSDPEPQPHGTFQNNAGINVGLFYRFGKIK